jgi:WD40 repeat protein
MVEFKIKNIIPTASEAKGLSCSNGAYFPSNTNLFKLQKNEFSLISSCDGFIKHFSVNGNFSFLCTEDRIYFNHFQHFIGSLKRSVTAIDSFDSLFAIGNNNVLEIWKIPTQYKFCQFTLKSKHTGHHRSISLIKFISQSKVITASEDCSVRLFDIENKSTKIIATLNDIPIAIHYFEDQCTITTRNGSITYLDLNSMEFKNVKFDGEIKSSSSFIDIVAISIKNMAIEDITPDIELLPSKTPIIKKKLISEKSTVILFKKSEEIFRCELDSEINEIALENSILYVRTANFIGSFDIQTESFIHTLSLPKILSISVFKNFLAASCADRSVCIYKDNTCVFKLQDPKSKGDILASHLSASICTVVYTSGYVSCFNINDSQCFRSFSVLDEPLGIHSCSCISEDGCFLIISNGAEIKIIDLIKGKLLETITMKSPILKLIFYRNFLYTLELDKVLTKHNVFAGISDNVVLEDLPVGMSIRDNSVVISTIKGLISYDLDLNILNSFSVQLESRTRNEMFSKSKPVEHVDFNSSFIFCGGQSNFLKIFENSFFNKDQKVLIKNQLVQIIQISRNRDLENFKAKIFHEKENQPFDKNRLIEVKNLVLFNDKLYIQTKDDVSIYEKIETSFSPIEFDILPTEDFIKNNLDNTLKSLIASIKLNDPKLINLVIDNCLDFEFTIKYLPERYALPLLEFVFEILKQDFSNLKFADILNKIIFYHKITIPGMLESLHSGIKPLYLDVKKNKYILESIIKK